MTEIEQDNRVIHPQAAQYNARLIRRVDQTDELAYFWVKIDGDPVPFEPGQYMTIGVFADDKLVQRPYSVASSPRVAGTDGYEFYVRLVPILRFTTLLWRLELGHEMRMIGPKGKFLLEPEDDRTLTRSGLFGSPKPLPERRSTSFTASRTSSHRPSGSFSPAAK
jgi:ferredoxin-NADP reductase